tara:strand:+ start:187 stop:1554 length:1368 start_codon:yes stop_codon:yes gene_type:complete
MKNERIVLTPGLCRDLKSKDKQYFVYDLNCPGLWLRIYPSGFKTWYYHYRPKGRPTTSIKLGRLEMLNPSQARIRAKEIQADIVRGNDPLERRKKWEVQLTFGEELKLWFKNSLTVPRFAKSTIKTIKGSLGVWIFHNTHDPEVRKKLNVLEDLKHKKLSLITKKHIKKLHGVISEKSPYMANRVVAYLKMFFNHVLDKDQDNPCKIPSEGFLNEEKEYLDFLNETELEAVINKAFKKDERNGRLLASHYKQRNLSPVSCCLIAFALGTGRRTRSEASNVQKNYLHMTGKKPRLVLPKTKTSRKQKDPKLSFGLGSFAVDVINTIKKENLFADSAFYFPSDERSKYLFPSKDFGRITGPNAKPGKTPYVVDVRRTWDKLLKMVGITRHLKVYATRHSVASAVLDKTGNLKIVAETLGTSVKTAAKYSKLKDDTVVETLDKIFESQKEDAGIRRVK